MRWQLDAKSPCEAFRESVPGLPIWPSDGNDDRTVSRAIARPNTGIALSVILVLANAAARTQSSCDGLAWFANLGTESLTIHPLVRLISGIQPPHPPRTDKGPNPHAGAHNVTSTTANLASEWGRGPNRTSMSVRRTQNRGSSRGQKDPHILLHGEVTLLAPQGSVALSRVGTERCR